MTVLLAISRLVPSAGCEVDVCACVVVFVFVCKFDVSVLYIHACVCVVCVCAFVHLCARMRVYICAYVYVHSLHYITSFYTSRQQGVDEILKEMPTSQSVVQFSVELQTLADI